MPNRRSIPLVVRFTKPMNGERSFVTKYMGVTQAYAHLSGALAPILLGSRTPSVSVMYKSRKADSAHAAATMMPAGFVSRCICLSVRYCRPPDRLFRSSLRCTVPMRILISVVIS